MIVGIQHAFISIMNAKLENKTMIRLFLIVLACLTACGAESVPEKPAKAKVDVTDAVCELSTLNWVCARHCIKFPENTYCKRFDAYCMTQEGIADVEFCSWWAENN